MSIRMEKSQEEEQPKAEEQPEEEEEEEKDSYAAIEIDNGQFELENCTITCELGSGVLAMNKFVFCH